MKALSPLKKHTFLFVSFLFLIFVSYFCFKAQWAHLRSSRTPPMHFLCGRPEHALCTNLSTSVLQSPKVFLYRCCKLECVKTPNFSCSGSFKKLIKKQETRDNLPNKKPKVDDYDTQSAIMLLTQVLDSLRFLWTFFCYVQKRRISGETKKKLTKLILNEKKTKIRAFWAFWAFGRCCLMAKSMTESVWTRRKTSWIFSSPPA